MHQYLPRRHTYLFPSAHQGRDTIGKVCFRSRHERGWRMDGWMSLWDMNWAKQVLGVSRQQRQNMIQRGGECRPECRKWSGVCDERVECRLRESRNVTQSR